VRSGAILIVALLAAALGLGVGYYLAADRNPQGDATHVTGSPKPQGKVLYYRNPMGLPDTSPVPKKDAMGMDYVPVHEGEDSRADPGTVTMSADRVQHLGVRTQPVATRDLARTVRAVGTLQVNERHQYTVAPKFEGWIEKLNVNVTGQPVVKGQPLMEVYSPELVSAQQEYAIARKGLENMPEGDNTAQAGLRRLADSSLARLRNWGISEAQLEQLQHSPGGRRTLVIGSPASGVVLEKKAVEGMRFTPGEMLYRIADLSTLWLIAEVFEQDLGLVKVGEAAHIRVNAYPDRPFDGRVSYIYPSVNPDTRTAQVRIELANSHGLLKPAMYASVELDAGGGAPVLAVPDSAVLDSGTRKLVLVERAPGKFEPREVKTGGRGGGYVEVLEGVKAGESVVVAANFLIDAESNLKAALGSFGNGGGDPAPGGESAHKGH
jgi:membrane fusion protein, copper/silver efflux system